MERAKQMAFEDLRGQMLAERQRREEERERKAEEDKEWARVASARAERDRAREEAARREVRLFFIVYLSDYLMIVYFLGRGGVEAEDGRGGAEGGAGALEEEAHGAQGKAHRLLAQGEQGRGSCESNPWCSCCMM